MRHLFTVVCNKCALCYGDLGSKERRVGFLIHKQTERYVEKFCSANKRAAVITQLNVHIHNFLFTVTDLCISSSRDDDMVKNLGKNMEFCTEN